MFPILNVGIGINKMSNQSEIDTMTPEQVMTELPLATKELSWEKTKRVLLYVIALAMIVGFVVMV